MKKCFICGIEINTRDGNHIYRCAKSKNLSLEKDEIRFRQISFDINHTFNAIEFGELYNEELYSLPDFLAKYSLPYTSTIFLIKYFKLKIRSIKDSANTSKRLEKYKITCVEKYGVENISQTESIKLKKKNTFLKNYGVDNIWKSDQFKKWYKSYMNETYGCGSLPNRHGNTNKWWANQNNEYKKDNAKRLQNGYQKWLKSLSSEERAEFFLNRDNPIAKIGMSKLEKQIHQMLDEENIPFRIQFWLARKSYDILLIGTKNIIEVNGDYWHANPDIYKSEDIIKYPDRTICAKERWSEDLAKINLAKKYGYTVFRLWEKDIRETPSMIREFLHSIKESDKE